MTDGRINGVNPAWRAAAVGLAIGVAAYAGVAGRAHRAERARESRVREVVEGPTATAAVVDAVDFDDAKLGDALASLAGRAGLAVAPRWSQMHVSADDRVTLHLRRTTVAAALDTLMVRARPPDGDPLAWAERGRVLHVSTETDLTEDEAAAVVRVYDVRDLLADQTSLPSWTDGGQGQQAAGSQNQQQSPASPDDLRADELKGVVESYVQPNTWKDNGGSVGTMTIWAGQLLVQQTPEGQRAVAAFLQLLRRPRGV